MIKFKLDGVGSHNGRWISQQLAATESAPRSLFRQFIGRSEAPLCNQRIQARPRRGRFRTLAAGACQMASGGE